MSYNSTNKGKRDKNMKLKKLWGCLLSLGMLLSPLTIYAEEDAGIVAYSMDPNDNRAFTSIVDAWDAACDGTLIYLNKDWNLSSRLIVPEGKNVKIDLYGHMISRQLSECESDGEVIYLSKNSSLSISGSQDGTFNVKNYKEDYTGEKRVDVTTGGVITGGMSSNGAGGIHMKENSTLNLDHVGVVGNKANGGVYADYGGGVKIDGDACTVDLKNGAMISYNRSSLGGGVYVNGQEGHINIDASEISSNLAERGGGIYSNCDATYIDLKNNGAIKDNEAYYDGGGISFFHSYNHINSEDATGKICSNLVRGEDGKAQGGGIYYDQVVTKTNTATITNVTIENNTANQSLDESYGGGIYSDMENIEITNCTINKNYARYGGGLYVNNDGITLKDTKITNNNAIEDGGGVYVDSRYDLKISGNMTVKDNTNYDGNRSNVFLQNGSFTRAYVSGTPSSGSEVGLTGDGSCKVGINQTENNNSFFTDNSDSYHIEYSDGKLYQKEGATSSIFGNGNVEIACIVIVGIATIGFIVYKKKAN